MAESLGWPATRVSTAPELRAAGPRGAREVAGPRVVVVRTDQRAEAALVRELRAAVGKALSSEA